MTHLLDDQVGYVRRGDDALRAGRGGADGPDLALDPSFADARVYRAGPAPNASTVPVAEPMRIWHLLTHTSALTYSFVRHVVIPDPFDRR